MCINKRRPEMKKIHLLSVCCVAFLSSGCDHYSTKLAAMSSTPQNVADISPAAGNEMTFSQYLASEYYHLARYEHDQRYDYKAAKYYTNKAERLSKGQMVSPASFSDFKVAPEKSEELASAREELISALKIYNVPENRYSLAVAQTRYDCWLEQQEEGNQNNDALTCKNEFRHAISNLVPPDHREVKIAVPFDSGSLVLTEAARISLGRVLSFWNNKKKGYHITLSPAVNMQQEEISRQISMVRSILQYNGIPSSDISVVPLDKSSSDLFEILLKQKEGEKGDITHNKPLI